MLVHFVHHFAVVVENIFWTDFKAPVDSQGSQNARPEKCTHAHKYTEKQHFYPTQTLQMRFDVLYICYKISQHSACHRSSSKYTTSERRKKTHTERTYLFRFICFLFVRCFAGLLFGSEKFFRILKSKTFVLSSICIMRFFSFTISIVLHWLFMHRT